MLEVSSFWDGELSLLERLCIASFVRQGITYNLYVYEEPEQPPPGVTLKDAAPILPPDKVFRYSAGNFNLGSIAGFTNLFRYTLIHQLGGWWVDTDVCLVRPFEFEQEELYFAELTQTKRVRVSTCCFKAPPGSPVMADCLRRFAVKDVTRIVHGETGPWLLTDSILSLGKQGVVLSNEQVTPVPWWQWRRLFYDDNLSLDGWQAVHFWNAMIAAEDLDKNARFPSNSPYERLKRAYLV